MPLVTMRQILDHAAENNYGVPAFNINDMEQIIAVLQAAKKVNAPVILQTSTGARKFAGDPDDSSYGCRRYRNVPRTADLSASGSRFFCRHLPVRDCKRLFFRNDGRFAGS